MKFNTQIALICLLVTIIVVSVVVGIIMLRTVAPIPNGIITTIGIILLAFAFICANIVILITRSMHETVPKTILHNRIVLIDHDSQFGKEATKLREYLKMWMGANVSGIMGRGRISCRIETGNKTQGLYKLIIVIWGREQVSEVVNIEINPATPHCDFAETAALAIARFVRDHDTLLP